MRRGGLCAVAPSKEDVMANPTNRDDLGGQGSMGSGDLDRDIDRDKDLNRDKDKNVNRDVPSSGSFGGGQSGSRGSQSGEQGGLGGSSTGSSGMGSDSSETR